MNTQKVVMSMKDHTRREGWIFRIGSMTGIVGSPLGIAMIGNLLHPATASRDPEGVARTIAESASKVIIQL